MRLSWCTLLDCSGCSCRSGNPLLSLDLDRVSVETARAIIVLATADNPDRSDARTLRVVLSLMGVHDRMQRAGRSGLKVSTRPVESRQHLLQASHSRAGWSRRASCIGRSLQCRAAGHCLAGSCAADMPSPSTLPDG